MLGLAYEGTQKGCGSFESQSCPSPHCCLKAKRLLLGEKESLRGIGTHRYTSNLLHTSLCLLTDLWPKKHRQAHVRCLGWKVAVLGGKLKEKPLTLSQVPQSPLKALHGRGQRPSSARDLLGDRLPAPCPLWASSPCKK